MKRFLLFAMMCACATIGVWADATLEVDDDKNFVFTTNGDGDLSTISDWLDLKGDGDSQAQSITVIGKLTSTGFANIINRINPYGTGGYQTKIDLSQADMEEFSLPNTTNLGYIYKLILPQGISIPDDYSNGSTLNVYNNLKTIYAFDGTTVTVVIVDANNPVSASTAISDTRHYTTPANYQVLCSDNAKAAALTEALKNEGKDVIEPAKPPYILNGCQLEITMPADGSGDLNAILADALSKVDESLFPNKELCELVINGPIKTSDLTCNSFKTVNCVSVDFSGATFLNSSNEEDCSIISSATADNIRYVIMPEGTPASVMKNTSFTGFTKFDAAGTIVELKNESDEGRDKYSLTATVKNEGTLFEITSRMRKLGSTPTLQTTSGVTSGITWYANVNKLEEIHLNGNLNFRDISQSNTATVQKLPADGHLYFTEDPVEGLSQATRKPISQDLNNQPQEVKDIYTVSNFAFDCNTMGIKVVDLGGAEFSHIEDMTLIYTGLLGTKTTKVVIPTSPSVKELPADFMNTASINIRSICIPSNIEIIRTRAFKTIDYVWTTSGVNDPEGNNTQLDNGAIYSDGQKFATDVKTHVETADFDYCAVPTGGSYTFSSNLKLIETAAFANSQAHVKDVYVLNTVAPECHVDAFNTSMYFGITGFSPVIEDGIITRDSYKNNGFWITMLHYPRQTTTPNVQRYTDPTRSYSIATGQRDGKGAILYFPNQSEFIRAYRQGTFGYTWNAWDPTRQYNAVQNSVVVQLDENYWTAENQAKANQMYNDYKALIDNGTKSEPYHQYYTFYDVTANGAVTNASSDIVPYYNVKYQSGTYSTSSGTQLYPQAGTTNEALNTETERDYRGWHQFVLTEYAANTTLEEEPLRSYITDNEWWTICPPFDITRKEAAVLYGKFPRISSSSETAYPFVSKLRYVIRDYVYKKITLNFSEDLTQNREEREHQTDIKKDENGDPMFNGDDPIYLGTNPDKHGKLDANGVLMIQINTINDDDVVMSAGVPYLIKPAMTDGAPRQFRIFRTVADRDSYVNNTSDQERAGLIVVASETLYDKIHASQAKTGTEQMADIHEGKYTVPVFVNGTNKDVKMENVEMNEYSRPKKYQISSTEYSKSTDWKYTFVGTFYKSYMPLHSYFLGWDSSLNGGNGGARFYYYDKEDTFTKNNMTWANETGIICPTYQSDFTYEVSPAGVAVGDVKTTNDPAQWVLTDIPDDSYVKASTGGLSKSYDMMLDAPEVFEIQIGGIATVVEDIVTENPSNDVPTEVYSVNGQFMGNSLEGLPKGVYVVNGKKMVVK